MKTKVYIDGSEGTTGLRINERFSHRDDIEIMTISSELRKDFDERKKFINESDITFLCLPDPAAREAVSMVENEKVKIIDSSTAHRTLDDWAYGLPELGSAFRENIKNGKRIAVPGCHATGFITLAHPIIKEGMIDANHPISGLSISGYSGGGKKMIAEYEAAERNIEYDAPREYALAQQHKHLKEMKKISGLSREPLFTPIVADYYNGMVVSIPLYADMVKNCNTPEKMHAFFADYYNGEKFIKVMPFGSETEMRSYMSGNGCSGWDGLEIYVTGNEDRILLTSRFDNLGKGASGAAIQCMNIMLGLPEDKGLNLLK